MALDPATVASMQVLCEMMAVYRRELRVAMPDASDALIDRMVGDYHQLIAISAAQRRV